MFNELILWIAELPNIVRVMFVGAVLGGTGGLLGAKLFPSRPPAAVAITAACAALTLPVNNSIITPFLVPLAFEAGFMKGAGEFPRRIDDVTIAESGGVYDNAMNFNLRLETQIDNLEVTRATIKQMLVSKPKCKELTGVLSPDVRAEKVVYRYKTNLGEIKIELVASDCR